MGDKRKEKTIILDQQQRDMVEKYAGYLTTDQLADLLGIARRTFFNILKRDTEVDALYKKARAQIVAKIANNLAVQATNGNIAAACFYLKTQAGWKENDMNDSAQINPINILMPKP